VRWGHGPAASHRDQSTFATRGECDAARLKAMVDSRLIEGAGDLRKWRFSEVRLKT
jgi:hypothetical protein